MMYHLLPNFGLMSIPLIENKQINSVKFS